MPLYVNPAPGFTNSASTQPPLKPLGLICPLLSRLIRCDSRKTKSWPRVVLPDGPPVTNEFSSLSYTAALSWWSESKRPEPFGPPNSSQSQRLIVGVDAGEPSELVSLYMSLRQTRTQD